MKFDTLKGYWENNSGNMTTIAALMAVPIVAGGLVAYDHAKFDTFQQSATAAIEAATMNVAQDDIMGSFTKAELDQRAKDYLFANLSRADEERSTVELVLTKKEKITVLYQLRVKLVYQPISGPLAAIAPARGNGGLDWTFMK